MMVFSRQVGDAMIVGDDVELTVVRLRAKVVTLEMRHTTLGGRVTLDDSFRRDAVVGDVVNLPVTGSCSVVDIRGDKVRLGMDAPKDLSIHRKEVWEAIKREKRSGRGLD